MCGEARRAWRLGGHGGVSKGDGTGEGLARMRAGFPPFGLGLGARSRMGGGAFGFTTGMGPTPPFASFGEARFPARQRGIRMGMRSSGLLFSWGECGIYEQEIVAQD